MRTTQYLLVGFAAAALAAGCGKARPGPDGGEPGADGGSDAGYCAAAAYTEDVSACSPAATDYQPRTMTPGANGWPTCISDDNTFHLIGTKLPSSVSRSVAFDTMGPKLWDNPNPPSKDEFLSARDDYSVAEGLASRVARRQDVSYPEVPGTDKFACANAGIPEQYPDRCAGPAKLKPLIDDAFQKGSAQTQPRVQAARIEAALVWFFYLSLRAETWSCSFSNITDCDSAAGYYSQLTARGSPAGLARYVASQGPETHERIYDALLAERCWRDSDPAMPASASSLPLYDLAQKQIEKAGLRGEALILRERIGWISCSADEEQQANIEFVKILGGFLDHGASGLDPANAAKLKEFTANPTAEPAAISAAQAAIDAIFGCP